MARTLTHIRLIAGGVASALVSAVLASPPAMADSAPRWFADRPIAWQEHDDEHLAVAPASNHLQSARAALTLRDSVVTEADRILSLEGKTAAQDVNAMDEVPCSTWFCARNHLRPMTTAEITAGPPTAVPPRLPLTITKGKDAGAASGYQVKDADGRKYMLKFVGAGHTGTAIAGEVIGNLIFHAAGYNVPGAFALDLRPDDLKLGAGATTLVFGVQPRPLTEASVRAALSEVTRADDGRIHAVAVPWVTGKLVGGFDMLGVRADDANDRIPHQHRRSLRASRVLFAWLSVCDPGSVNTIDSYVEEAGRRFVRHHFFDFGCALGSSTTSLKGPHEDGEYVVEVGRTLAALFSLGLYRRPFQDRRPEWTESVARHPSIGYFPAEGFDPDAYRSQSKLPAAVRMTERDAYWGAKLVTAFSDEQIAALVQAAQLPDAEAPALARALRVRRDVIGRRYLRAVAAIENPSMAPDSSRVCFEDLAIARGYAQPAEVTYMVEATDGEGGRVAAYEQVAGGPVACVSIGDTQPYASGYRVVSIRARFIGAAGRSGRNVDVSKASRVHLRWRDGAGRFVLVGLERDE
jgi:hypothetical protein